MKVIETELKDCYIIEPDVFGDHRGYFYQTYSEKDLNDAGIDVHFVQGNESFTANKNTIRGLHFQTSEMAQAKLVRCTSGAIYDIAVDLRKNSPTYKKWIKVELSNDNKRQMFLPRGFAHGFLTLTDNVTFVYEVDNFYSKEHDAGFAWNDPEIGVDWGLDVEPILSDKDKNAPLLKNSRADF